MKPQNRVKPGVPTGGQYAATEHTEGSVALETHDPRIRIPSDTSLHRMISQDTPSNGERRSLARTAVDQALDGDDFDVVRSPAVKDAVRAEADRDDSLDRALERVIRNGGRPHQLGDDLATELAAIRNRREAVESHYVTGRQELYDEAAAHLDDSPADYEAALKRIFPYAGPIWYERTVAGRSTQTLDQQRHELGRMAVVAERDLVLRADRPEVSVEENPNFTSHPVSPLESAIDALISRRGDPTCDENVRYLANHTEGGAGYGNVFIRQIAEKRLAAWRHVPIERTK